MRLRAHLHEYLPEAAVLAGTPPLIPFGGLESRIGDKHYRRLDSSIFSGFQCGSTRVTRQTRIFVLVHSAVLKGLRQILEKIGSEPHPKGGKGGG